MKILLKQEGNDLPIATMEVGEVFTPDKPLETLKCYGTSQLEHPGGFCVFPLWTREGGGSTREFAKALYGQHLQCKLFCRVVVDVAWLWECRCHSKVFADVSNALVVCAIPRAVHAYRRLPIWKVVSNKSGTEV